MQGCRSQHGWIAVFFLMCFFDEGNDAYSSCVVVHPSLIVRLEVSVLFREKVRDTELTNLALSLHIKLETVT